MLSFSHPTVQVFALVLPWQCLLWHPTRIMACSSSSSLPSTPCRNRAPIFGSSRGHGKERERIAKTARGSSGLDALIRSLEQCHWFTHCCAGREGEMRILVGLACKLASWGWSGSSVVQQRDDVAATLRDLVAILCSNFTVATVPVFVAELLLRCQCSVWSELLDLDCTIERCSYALYCLSSASRPLIQMIRFQLRPLHAP